jgi:hypothetical protein
VLCSQTPQNELLEFGGRSEDAVVGLRTKLIVLAFAAQWRQKEGHSSWLGQASAVNGCQWVGICPRVARCSEVSPDCRPSSDPVGQGFARRTMVTQGRSCRAINNPLQRQRQTGSKMEAWAFGYGIGRFVDCMLVQIFTEGHRAGFLSAGGWKLSLALGQGSVSTPEYLASSHT